MTQHHSIPYGFCQCGCGQRTPIAIRNEYRRGHTKGEPTRFVRGHHDRNSLGTVPQRLREGYREQDCGYSTPCWIWLLTPTPDGYGTISINGRHRPVHRISYEHFVGNIPAGLHIDHLCRNRRCMNPGHLEPVTLAENVRRGANAKLTRDAVARIRQSTATNGALAAEHGVTAAAISHVRNGVTWAGDS